MRKPPKQNRSGIALILLAVLFVALLLVYLLVLAPMFDAKEDDGGGSEPPNLILMFPRVERASMASIEVFNVYDEGAGAYSGYAFRRDLADEDGDGDTADFIIVGHEANFYNEELFSSLVVDAGYTACLGKLEGLDFSGDAVADEAVFARYGLDKDSHPVYYVLTETDGTVYRVYIGATSPDGNYYARLDGTEEVYILYSALETSILAPLESFIEPRLTLAGESTFSYIYIRNFSIFKNSALKDILLGGGVPGAEGEVATLDPYVMFSYLPTGERDLYHAASIYAMLAPNLGYTPNDLVLDSILASLPGLTGTETKKTGLSPSDFEEGGLLENLAYTLYYEMPYGITYDEHEDPIVTTWVTNVLFVTERAADGSYTVGSLSYRQGEEEKMILNQIATVPYEALYFLDFTLYDWVEPRMLSVAINNVARLEFSSSRGDYIFHIMGDGRLSVSEAYSGYQWKTYEVPQPFAPNAQGYCDDINQFKELYMLLLQLHYEGDIAEDTGMSEEQIAAFMQDDAACMMTLTLTMDDGREMTYRFYPYSERHAMVSVTGAGIPSITRFYTNRLAVRRIADATYDLLHGVEIDADRRFQ